MNNWEERSERLWKSNWMSACMMGLCLTATVWALVAVPSPGVSIGILGTVAAVMSLRPEMRPLEKAGWIVIVTALLIGELHSIRENDRTVAEERKAQSDKLQNLNNESETIINNLRAIVIDVDKTLRQTQPHAAIRFDRFEFAGSPPTQFAAGVPYHFNFHYTNGGSLTAKHLRLMAKIYIGRADDKQTQIDLARRFEKDWKSSTPKISPPLVPDNPLFGTVEKTLDSQELAKLAVSGTIYYFVRFVYSDDNGNTWGTDACGAFQRESPTTIDTNIAHPCSVFQRFRYPIKTHEALSGDN